MKYTLGYKEKGSQNLQFLYSLVVLAYTQDMNGLIFEMEEEYVLSKLESHFDEIFSPKNE